MEQTTKFVVGETYYGDSGDGKQEQFKVVSRTPKFITLSGNMILTTQRVKVTVEGGKESAVYAMTSWCKFVIRADSAVKEADNKEDTVMKKKSSVNETVSAVKASGTLDEVKAVLEGCTKALIVEVYAQMYDSKISVGWKKSDIINAFVRAEENRRSEEAFKALTVEEKIQNLRGKHYYENVCWIALCTNTELEEMAELLGAELETEWMDTNPRYALERGVNKALIDNKEGTVMAKKVSIEPASKDDDLVAEPAEVSYADVKEAYGRYNMAQGEYEDSHREDERLKAIADEALNKYLDLLKVYARKPSAEQEEVKDFLLSEFGGLYRPLDGVVYLSSNVLVEMSHKAGLHADWRMSSRDMGIRLLRWSGIGCEMKTAEEQDMQEMKNLNERKDSLETEITDKRRELLGIAEALKVMKGSRYYSGLLVIKARVEDEYKLLRLESLRVRKKLRWYAEHLDELREMLKEILTESCEQLLVAI